MQLSYFIYVRTARFRVRGFRENFSGDHGGEETRVPIPNTNVKGPSGDGTVV